LKTLTQYREEIKALMKKAGDIDAKCTAENRELTEAELALKNEILDTVEEIRKVVMTTERQERVAAALEAPTAPPASRPSPQPQPAGRPQDRFRSAGEQFMAIMNAGMPGGQVDPRLRNITGAISGIGETVPSDGGFLVQQDFSQELLQDLFATGGLWSRVGMRIPISGNANGTKINGVDETSRASSSWGGIVTYWTGEANKPTSTLPKFRKIELDLKKLMGLCYATDENLSDSAQLESIIRRGFNSDMGFRLDDALLNGTGAGQPLGFLNAGSLVSVAAETGQKAATIMAENVIKMYSRMFASSLSSAIWLINQNTLPQLLTMSIAVGTGGVPVYLPPGNTLINAPGGALMGRPVYPVEQCATLGTVGDIVFVDVANGYVVAEKGGLKSDMSIHLRFDYDESVFRFIMRVDGQPVRATALTPYKGGSTSTNPIVSPLRLVPSREESLTFSSGD
jgi:HK97 family phage major capsid protein